MEESKSEIALLNDNEWRKIDGELCRVIEFVPMASVKNGNVKVLEKGAALASLHFFCSRFPKKEITGFVTHKLDFLHLWNAFKERRIKPEEEVLFLWTSKNYKNNLYKFLSPFMPKLWVMICQKGAFELITDRNYRPELQGEARFNAERSIVDWKPEVMK